MYSRGQHEHSECFKDFSTVAPGPAGSKISRNRLFDEFFDSVLSNQNGSGWPLSVIAIYLHPSTSLRVIPETGPDHLL